MSEIEKERITKSKSHNTFTTFAINYILYFVGASKRKLIENENRLKIAIELHKRNENDEIQCRVIWFIFARHFKFRSAGDNFLFRFDSNQTKSKFQILNLKKKREVKTIF